MSSQTKAAWLRRIFVLLLFAGAATAGSYAYRYLDWRGREKHKSTAVEITKENIERIQGKPGVLTITNMRLDGNPDSKKLQEILEELKKNKYGEKVQLAQVDLEKELQIAAEAGVVDLKEFAGHLDFHTEGRKLGDLIGETDPKVVEATIDRLLAGMVRRVDKHWLPDVPGMERDRGRPVLTVKPAINSP